MDRGFVFSMDAAYAIFILLLATATITVLLSSSQRTNQQNLYLSRVARDIQDVNQSMDGNLNPNNIDWIRINDECDNADQVGSHRAVVYVENGEGDLKTVKTEVCPK